MSESHWTQYWRSGALTSLPTDFKSNYDGELAAFWHAEIEPLSSDAQVLDLCTGNGAVALLMSKLAASMEKKFRITAVDGSDIKAQDLISQHPHVCQYIHEINFIGNCMIESIDERLSGHFDFICSQYGLEYCEIDQVANKIFDLLKPGGRLSFITHSPKTAMLDYMRNEEQVYARLKHLGAFDLMKQFAAGKVSANHFKNKMKVVPEQLWHDPDLIRLPLLNTWMNALNQLLQMNNVVLKAQQQRVGLFASQHLAARERALDMLNVTQKLTDDPTWYEPLEVAGFDLDNDGEIVYQGKHNVGHYYRFVKSAD